MAFNAMAADETKPATPAAGKKVEAAGKKTEAAPAPTEADLARLEADLGLSPELTAKVDALMKEQNARRKEMYRDTTLSEADKEAKNKAIGPRRAKNQSVAHAGTIRQVAEAPRSAQSVQGRAEEIGRRAALSHQAARFRWPSSVMRYDNGRTTATRGRWKHDFGPPPAEPQHSRPVAEKNGKS